MPTPTAKNKIKYGLSNVYYAKANFDGSAVTYTAPVPISGAVNLTISPQGESTPVYADNIEYHVFTQNNGYDGSIEMIQIPDSFKADILGETLTESGVQVENSNAKLSKFALLFQFEGDITAKRHVLYYCQASRLDVESATKADSAEVSTDTLNITVRPRPDTKDVKANSTESVNPDVYNAWFADVWSKEDDED